MLDVSAARLRALTGRLDLCAINTATLGHRAPISEIVEQVARAGYGGIAPWRREIEGEDVRAVARRIADAGLQVSGYCRSTYFPAETTAGAKAAIAENRRALHDAATLGAACFVLVVGGLPRGSRDLDGARAQVRDGVAALLEDARRLGVPLALEPLHPMYAADRSCLTTLAEALDLCDALDPDGEGGIGVAIDVYHVWWDPALAEGIAHAGRGGRILAFHVCDWLVPTADMLLDRGMMGDGVIDIPRIRAMVEGAGFGGKVECEIFSAANWWRRPPEEVLKLCAERFQNVC
jgi:sugar phosphate isomerase/epimerase